MSKNSLTLEEASKAWEKKQESGSKTQNRVPPNLKLAGRRTHHSTVDNEGFIEPRKFVKTKSASNPEMATPTTSNQFQLLNTDDRATDISESLDMASERRQNNDEDDQTSKARKINETR